MPISTAEKNRRKRERKKKQREEEAKKQQQQKEETTKDDDDVEIEYVTEVSTDASNTGLPPSNEHMAELEQVMQRYQEKAIVSLVSDDDDADAEAPKKKKNADSDDDDSDDDDDEEDDEAMQMSKRKWREMVRPSVSELKRRVQRPDLVDAHDVTADNPDFLIELKSVDGTVPVPRHWGRKRKYLQGKRGYEKPPFQLPDFILKTGIADIRDTLAEDEAGMSAKQKNRGRVAPKMGAMDVDYRILHEAFFKHQTKPTDFTKFGDLYYEGKELETSSKNVKPGKPLSKALREALGMIDAETSPPPYLMNMQRYGPPPSYGHLRIPGLNAPLPNDKCQYGFHTGGWGKPPVDAYGNPLYGGNPFDPPGSKSTEDSKTPLVTSSGSTLVRNYWGSLPLGDAPGADEESSDEESDDSDDDDDESMDESVETTESADNETEEVPDSAVISQGSITLRKDVKGDETPAQPQKQLYKVLEAKDATGGPDNAMFKSQVEYVLPTAADDSAKPGAESVIMKTQDGDDNNNKKKKKRKKDDDDEGDLGKGFKF